jgi:MFS family permease
MSTMVRNKARSIAVLILAEMLGMSIWFTSAAILPDMARETEISTFTQASLSSAVQAGFVFGALVIAISGLADRLDPRHLFAACALSAATANGLLSVVAVGGGLAVFFRFLSGCLLAGVYPVGMKIAVGWGTRDRGLLVGSLIGALTLGKSTPFLWAYVAGENWRATVIASSAMAAAGAILVLAAGLGPAHARAQKFEPAAIRLAWTDARIRSAYLGYFGHMWELFAMWAWVGAIAASSYGFSLDGSKAQSLGKITGFAAIGLGALACVIAGRLADRIGKAEVAMLAMAGSGTAALLTSASFGGPAWLTFVFIVLWGIAIIPDSAQFSALVADFSPPHLVGSLLTFQTALGFALTIATVQLTPVAADHWGWPVVLAGLALGPALGIVAMYPLRRQ